MPIEKLQVIHRFGILTDARRDEMVQRVVADDDSGVTNQNKRSPRLTQNERTLQMVHQLDSATTEIQLLSLEDEAAKFLEKIKFQISTVDSKKRLNNLDAGWRELTLFISCKGSRKLQDSALHIFQRSLCDAPLSKSLVSALVETAFSNTMELGIGNEISSPWVRKSVLLCEVIFLSCSRLYYHYLVQDLNEDEINNLGDLSVLFSKASIDETKYQDNPILQNMIEIVSCMISAICPAKREEEGLHKDSMNVETNFKYTEDINSLSSSDNKEKKAPISSILWNCLKLWKSVSRRKQVEERVLNNLRFIDFSAIDTKHKRWLDYILAFYTLCECAKLNVEYLKIFLKFRPKLSSKIKTVSLQSEKTGTPRNNAWCLDLVITYLRCLADVCMHGMSISTQRLALLGDDGNYGLVDYLVYVPENKDSFKVTVCAYQFLSDTYSFYQSDPMKEGLKNIAWNHLLRFRSTNGESVKNIICNYQIKTDDQRQSIVSIFSKIATNLCVLAFSPTISPRNINARNCVDETKRRPNNSSCFEKQGVTKKTTKESSSQTHYNKEPPHEKECWLEIQRIAEEHFQTELEDDEREKEILLQQKVKEDGVAASE